MHGDNVFCISAIKEMMEFMIFQRVLKNADKYLIDFGYLLLDSIVYLLLVTFDQLFRWFFHVGLAMILVAVHACKI